MSDYHGWTHALKEDGGTDPIPFPSGAGIDSVVYMEFELQTIATSAETNLEGGTVGQEVVKGDAMTVDNTTGRVTFVEDGVYAAWLNTQWEDATTMKKGAQIVWTVSGEQVIPYASVVQDEADVFEGLDSPTVCAVRFVNITGGSNFLSGVVWQNSGGNKDVTADLTVVQLAAITFP